MPPSDVSYLSLGLPAYTLEGTSTSLSLLIVCTAVPAHLCPSLLSGLRVSLSWFFIFIFSLF